MSRPTRFSESPEESPNTSPATSRRSQSPNSLAAIFRGADQPLPDCRRLLRIAGTSSARIRKLPFAERRCELENNSSTTESADICLSGGDNRRDWPALAITSDSAPILFGEIWWRLALGTGHVFRLRVRSLPQRYVANCFSRYRFHLVHRVSSALSCPLDRCDSCDASWHAGTRRFFQ